MIKLDVLAFGAHPDDVEMTCSGTLAKLAHQGKKTGIIDLTRGELGTRGTPELRMKEAQKAAEVLGLSARENLGFKDVFFTEDEFHLKEVIRMIRKYQPEIVIGNALSDRHPDHGKGSKLVRNAVFMSGLRKIETFENGVLQPPWRPKKYFTYIQDQWITPDFIVDVSDYFDIKLASVKAYASQFYNPESDEPETYISTAVFWDHFTSRAHAVGHLINVTYGEGFNSETPLAIDDLMSLC